MIAVFIEIIGQNGQRTMIPGGPFANCQAGYAALCGYAVANYGDYQALIQAINAYGFVGADAGPAGQSATVGTPTKP